MEKTMGEIFIVATPIGNLGEITLRALEVLKSVDTIACENPLHSLKLLKHYSISKPLISYFKHNEMSSSALIINKALEGNNIALICDSGMPLISDPGLVLVKQAREKGIRVSVVSGACAAISALVLSGADSSQFLMLGFLPASNSEKEKFIQPYKALPCTLIVYSAPHDLESDLKFLAHSLGDRNVFIVREISKVFEQVVQTTLGSPLEKKPKGEYVLIIEGEKNIINPLCELSPIEHVEHYLAQGLSKNDAIKATAKDRGVLKNEIYKLFFD